MIRPSARLDFLSFPFWTDRHRHDHARWPEGGFDAPVTQCD
jgi:hypothetical protein